MQDTLQAAEFSFQCRVYSEDTDSFGIVHHANYLKFMERARLEWIATLGHNLGDWTRAGILFVVQHADLSYLRPARAYDLLEVHSTVVSVRKVRLIYRHEVRSRTNPEHVYCRGDVTVVCIDADMKPRILPDLLLRGMMP